MEEKSWRTWKSNQNIVMDEELVQDVAMGEQFVKNFVMGAEIDPKIDGSVMADFGQTDFGQTNFGQLFGRL